MSEQETPKITSQDDGQSASTGGLAATFTITPQLVDLDYGPEPSLYTILCRFYEDRGMTPESARRTAVAYSLEWSKLVANEQISPAAEGSPRGA